MSDVVERLLSGVSNCTRPEGCVCGGDLPAIRRGCGWFESDPIAAEAAAEILSLRAQLAGQEAVSDAVHRELNASDAVVGEIATLSNPDWDDARVDCAATLDRIHAVTGKVIVPVLRRESGAIDAAYARGVADATERCAGVAEECEQLSFTAEDAPYVIAGKIRAAHKS